MTRVVKGYEIGPGAALNYADLRSANLRSANLIGTDLRSANLRSANLIGTDLRSANLIGTDLRRAYLTNANLIGTDLRSANLIGTDLRRAYLTNANLIGANLRGAKLHGADIRGAKLPDFQIPQTGEIIGWKKLDQNTVAKVLVPATARRTATLVGDKCRATVLKTLEIYGPGRSSWRAVAPTRSGACRTYAVGKVTVADWYDDDIRIECAHGLHFFLTRRAAEMW
jgi:uncharacterized protein YjbI with pentapeptide repeats